MLLLCCCNQWKKISLHSYSSRLICCVLCKWYGWKSSFFNAWQSVIRRTLNQEEILLVLMVMLRIVIKTKPFWAAPVRSAVAEVRRSTLVTFSLTEMLILSVELLFCLLSGSVLSCCSPGISITESIHEYHVRILGAINCERHFNSSKKIPFDNQLIYEACCLIVKTSNVKLYELQWVLRIFLS